MNALISVLVLAAAISLLLNLVGKYEPRPSLVYVFKPLTIVMVIAVALLQSPADLRYRAAVVIGLLLSLAGDVFLMLPRDRFVYGLGSFLLAHLAYLVAFTSGVRFGASLGPFAAFGLAGAVLLSVLWPHLGRLKAPVVLYWVVILAMAAQAAARAVVLGSTAALAAAVGGALFVCSDSVLAINRFRSPFLLAQALVMTTYVAAQLLIALSVAG